MSVSEIISLLSGVAMFLFGMTLMGDGLKRVAGSKLELVLYRLSNTTLKGVLLGTGVTAVIQSSCATSARLAFSTRLSRSRKSRMQTPQRYHIIYICA